jgi:hypothetical protein
VLEKVCVCVCLKLSLLFVQILPDILQDTIASSIDMRQSLPMNYLSFMGVTNANSVYFVLFVNAALFCYMLCEFIFYFILFQG